ncbi:MAG: hypothetical protein R3C45_12380 [Phycisphaerales bacterium]
MELLDELADINFRRKSVDHIRFSCYPGTASWRGINDDAGYIEVHEKCEAGAIAHELGHGFHECLRDDFDLDDDYGDDYAEAIRWFVEKKLGETKWCDDFKKQSGHKAILEHCEYDWAVFMDKMRAKKFYPSTSSS